VAGLVGDAEQLATSDPQVACEAYAKATLALNGVREAAVRQITALAEKAVASKDTGMAVYFYEQELRLAPGNGAAQAYLFRNKFKPGQVLNTPTGLTMAYVPPGNFSQGTPAGEPGRDADETQRAVTITRGFHLGVSEVTQGQWDRVMGANDAENRLLGARLKHEFLGANKPMIW
jgi:formylglycine-generating enzyme required for sulfatase activity